MRFSWPLIPCNAMENPREPYVNLCCFIHGIFTIITNPLKSPPNFNGLLMAISWTG